MKNSNNKPFTLFCRYASRHKSAVFGLTLIYVAATALLVLAPQALSRFIDGVYEGSAWHASILAILLYLAAMLAQAAAAAVLDYRLASVGQRITDDFRRDIMSHYLSLDHQHLSGLTSGEMMTRLNQDTQGLFKYYYILFYKLAGSALALVGILAALFTRVGWLSAALLAVSALSILGFKLIQDRGIAKYVRRVKASAAFNSQMKELIDNAPSLRALSAEDYANQQTHSSMKERFRESFPANLMYANLWSASTVMEGLLVGCGLLVALILWDAGSITLGVAYLIYTYSELIISPMQDFRNHMGNMQDAKAGILRTRDFLNTPAKVRGGYLTLKNDALELDVQNVRFAYENGADVLRGVSLSVPAGTHIGIMGETGCGKSTLLGLIARLNAFEHGLIRLGGLDIREISFASLRERLAYCTQRVQLIHGSLRDNITLFAEHYTDDDIWEAIRLLELTEWFQIFPDGLDTRLVMGEDSLSSGEAQLIALVRLSLRQPGLVLLDEITSNLDTATEARVMHAVEALCKGRTVIAIAHRAEALAWMDHILLMEGGKVHYENK